MPGSFGEGTGCRPGADPVSGTLVSPVVKVFEHGWGRGGCTCGEGRGVRVPAGYQPGASPPQAPLALPVRLKGSLGQREPSHQGPSAPVSAGLRGTRAGTGAAGSHPAELAVPHSCTLSGGSCGARPAPAPRKGQAWPHPWPRPSFPGPGFGAAAATRLLGNRRGRDPAAWMSPTAGGVWGEASGSCSAQGGTWALGTGSLQPPTLRAPLALPLQAVAIVCGFLIVILLCVICFFAHKTRSKIWKYGKQNVYWDKVPVAQEGPNVEEWVSLSVGWGCRWVPGGWVLRPPTPEHPSAAALARCAGAVWGPRSFSRHRGCAKLGLFPFPSLVRTLCQEPPACATPVPAPGVFARGSRQLPGCGIIATGVTLCPALAASLPVTPFGYRAGTIPRHHEALCWLLGWVNWFQTP